MSPSRIVAEHTVPGTSVVISIEYYDGAYTVTRRPGTGTVVNYIRKTWPTEAEARQDANALWADTVTRRNRFARKR